MFESHHYLVQSLKQSELEGYTCVAAKSEGWGQNRKIFRRYGRYRKGGQDSVGSGDDSECSGMLSGNSEDSGVVGGYSEGSVDSVVTRWTLGDSGDSGGLGGLGGTRGTLGDSVT